MDVLDAMEAIGGRVIAKATMTRDGESTVSFRLDFDDGSAAVISADRVRGVHLEFRPRHPWGQL